MKCPNCLTGFLQFEIGYIVYNEGMGAVHSEDRIVCVNCSRYRYLTEQEPDPSPKGRATALPVEVLAATAPPAALRRARRYMNAQGTKAKGKRRYRQASEQAADETYDTGYDGYGIDGSE